jgi:hypothetical protein
MRLLERSSASEFVLTKDFARDDQIPPYAILSHTWGADAEEVTLKDLMDGSSKSKPGYEKIKFCGEQARYDGLQYFWVDTCCVDKSNNNELTTAINSMFRWYRNAARCYVYLSDVLVRSLDGKSVHVDWESAFRNSRWFRRGWTLQELLAPKIVDFYSRDHIRLGDKHSLEQQILGTTGIAIGALRGRSLSEFSIEERFSWAEKRQTTREEDKVYCLLGIFGVFLSLIYGEGQSNAIRRLRKEIKECVDTESQRIGNVYRRPYHSLVNSSLNDYRSSKPQFEYCGGNEEKRYVCRTYLRGRRHVASSISSISIRADLILEPNRREPETTIPDTTIKDAYVAVMGSIGSGKSSLIKLLTGQDVPVGFGIETCMLF